MSVPISRRLLTLRETLTVVDARKMGFLRFLSQCQRDGFPFIEPVGENFFIEAEVLDWLKARAERNARGVNPSPTPLTVANSPQDRRIVSERRQS